MLPVSKQVTRILPALLLALLSAFLFAQSKIASPQFTAFKRLTTQADVIFDPPRGFREIKALNNEDFTFDHAMDLPGKGFEVWYMVRSQKENWASYERVMGNEKLKLANPDSIYIDIGQAHAIAFTGERDSFIKSLPPSVLKRYNADAGRSYLLTLADMPETRHYRYALLISLQKFHTSTMMMVCFTNNKTPEFYKNVERAGSSVKFKATPNSNVSKLAD